MEVLVEPCAALLEAEVTLLLDSLAVEDDDAAVEEFDTLKDVRVGVEEKVVDGADDAAALEEVGGGKTEPRVDPCEIGITGVASD